jgi:hypothetical protein
MGRVNSAPYAQTQRNERVRSRLSSCHAGLARGCAFNREATNYPRCGDLDESSLSARRARQMAKPSRRKIASVRLLFQVLLESMLNLRGPRCQDRAQALVSLTNALKISSIEVPRKVNRDPEPGELTSELAAGLKPSLKLQSANHLWAVKCGRLRSVVSRIRARLPRMRFRVSEQPGRVRQDICARRFRILPANFGWSK